MELTTNQIVKKLFKKCDKFSKKDFVKFLKVDVETVEPIDFTGMKYDKNKHSECLFMFLDNNHKIIGFLLGNVHSEKFDKWENYSYGSDRVGKNRKQMTEKADMILMFTPEMRNYSEIQNKKFKPAIIKDSRTLKKELLCRLEQYKQNKYNNVDFEQVKDRAFQVMNVLVKAAFENDKEIINRAIKASGWSDSEHGFDSIRHFGDDCRNLFTRWEDVEKYKKQHAEMYPNEEIKGSYFNDYTLNYYNIAKVKIIFWYNLIINNVVIEKEIK